MIEAYDTADVYAAETDLIARLPEGERMARAVDGLVAVAAARLEGRDGARVVALVGPGNNGADALYAVARLAEAGFPTAALTTETIHEGAHAAATAAGVVLVAGADAPSVLADADLVLDGILGIGGRPEVPDFARGWIEGIPGDAYLIAVDLPTGADPAGRSGDPDGVFADETVTFSVLKPVHLAPVTEARCGRLTVVDIGLELDVPPAVVRLTRDDVTDRWPVPGPTDDKYSRGVVGVVAGSDTYPGAAVLACAAAVESGAGMVRYVGPDRAADLVQATAPEVVPGPGRVQAWVIGSGIDGTDLAHVDGAQLEAIEQALGSDLPVVIDAGGLDLLADTDLQRRRGRPTLLTPHAGECARLLGVERAEVEADPIGAAQELVAATGATVLLKGAVTVIAAPDPEEPIRTQADAPAWLATAGAGDVLAGLLGTLLAAGLAPAEAGALGALVHGGAADDANPGGPVRALAVAHEIPRTVARLLRR